jgi:hydrogenase maturation protease
VAGEPGQCFRYGKEEFMLKRLPIKMSPHQIGVQEMLLISEMRGHCPEELFLWGVIPASLEPGNELTPNLERLLVKMAGELVEELRGLGVAVEAKE